MRRTMHRAPPGPAIRSSLLTCWTSRWRKSFAATPKRGDLRDGRAREALQDLADFPLIRFSHEPFLERMWELRHSLSAYDAAYIALAEALNAPLVTCDARLARAHGHGARVEVLSDREQTAPNNT